GKSPQDLGVQLDYLWQELNTTESGSLAALKQTNSAAEAAVSFEENFERAGIPNNEARVANANAVLKQFGDVSVASQVGEGFYERGLSVFGANKKADEESAPASGGVSAPSSAASGGGAPSSGEASSSGGAAAP